MEIRFLADCMLGRLAKWLRVMGCDTHYQPYYNEGVIDRLVHEGRLLLSRHSSIIDQYPNSLLILSDHVKEQLQEIRSKAHLRVDRSKWFRRCLTCNIPLKDVSIEDARENIPEYVFYQNITSVRFCPSCSRYFWPGSHRNRMINQLKEWGFRHP
ncbi:Mut7-C RNAse domain-containing protein [Thermodesulfobacteriota bacterium]